MNIKATVKNSDLGGGISSRLTPDDMSAILEQLLNESTQGVTQSRALECARILNVLVDRIGVLLDDAKARTEHANDRIKAAETAELDLAFKRTVGKLMRKLEPTDDETPTHDFVAQPARTKRSWFK